MRLLYTLAAAALLAGCGANTPDRAESAFFDSFKPYCGQAFEGKLVSTDAADADFAAERIVMHVRECSAKEIRIPLHVGDNRSRTWIVSRTDTGLRLKHDHRHDDGHADDVTMYGGDNDRAGSTSNRQMFPADAQSKTMFDAASIPDSKQNIWAVEVRPSENLFAYEMSRPNRFFRLEFDLSAPVTPPPPAWGYSE